VSEPLIIFGNGQMAEVALARFRRGDAYEVVGFTVDRAHVASARFCDLPLVPFDEVTRHFPAPQARLFVAVGPVRVNRLRAERFAQAAELGYRFATWISPRAIVDPEARIGDNCSIGDAAVVAPFVRIGDGVRVGSASVIGHHSVLEAHGFVGVASVLGGSVHLGQRVLVGMNATLRDRIAVGEGAVIGAGATIVRDVAAGAVLAAPEAVALSVGADRLSL
jgi:sugar O-acyltransferase (sialic acid O-acetyltransferase NeuD family)